MARVEHVPSRPTVPAGRHGFPLGLFFLGDALFADGNDSAAYLFDLREPYTPEQEEWLPEGKQDAA